VGVTASGADRRGYPGGFGEFSLGGTGLHCALAVRVDAIRALRGDANGEGDQFAVFERNFTPFRREQGAVERIEPIERGQDIGVSFLYTLVYFLSSAAEKALMWPCLLYPYAVVLPTLRSARTRRVSGRHAW
jgi:hypothetical protein